jgi:hypothetical protein|tara:strand:+ start:652 stop:858 length:207 start_codon:yes stop_codon:yes gene_type:complete
MANEKWFFKSTDKHHKVHSDWQPCTVKEKEKLEKMRPNFFEFKEKVKPEKTPSMGAADLEAEEKKGKN